MGMSSMLLSQMLKANQCDSIEDFVSRSQAVDGEQLTLVEIVKQSPEVVEWSRAFCQPKQCFNNALQMSYIDGCDLVIGYVVLPYFGIAIEHAWNADESGHFDLTAQCYWSDETLSSEAYTQLLRLSAKEAMTLHNNERGIDHMALRLSEQYQHLFMRNQRDLSHAKT